MNVIAYLFNTVRKEIVENIEIFQAIVTFHFNEIQERRHEKKVLAQVKLELSSVETYNEWKEKVLKLDQLPLVEKWKLRVKSKHYDYKYILNLKTKLQVARIGAKVEPNASSYVLDLIDLIRSHPFRNIANILNQELYQQSYIGTKVLIEEFVEEMQECIKTVARTQHINLAIKLEFFAELRHALGRTALIFAGGAFLGLYHIGVAKTLFELDLLPKIIAGSSSGSMIAAFLATTKREDMAKYFQTDKAAINYKAFLQRDPKNSSWRKLQRYISEGYILDMNIYKKFLRDNLGDKTFQEAYDETGFILNITVTGAERHAQDRVLNYLTAPNVVIWSAVCCSCSLPSVFPASDLYKKNRNGQLIKYVEDTQFLDGLVTFDVPHQKLSELFNVSSTIVSEVNPNIAAIIHHTETMRFKSKFELICIKFSNTVKKFFSQEIKMRLNQLSQLGQIYSTCDYPSLFNYKKRVVNIGIVRAVKAVEVSYKGDVTVQPAPKLTNFASLWQTPTSADFIDSFAKSGQQRTFCKVPFIQILSFFERTVEDCYQEVKREYYSAAKNDREMYLLLPNQREAEDEQTENVNRRKILIDRDQSFCLPERNKQIVLNNTQQ